LIFKLNKEKKRIYSIKLKNNLHQKFLKGCCFMNIVGVAACTAGVAHTYLAKEKLVNAAQESGHIVKIETQGTIGTEDGLSTQEIDEADVVIIAADIGITGRDRFKEKKVLQIPTHIAMKSSKSIIKKIEDEINTTT
jgi:PTS system fructose-specific IIB component